MKKSQAWFRNAGVGIFIHWGVYSVIGRGEWAMQQEQIPLDEYDRNIEKFRAEKYDPNEWAQLAKFANMRYMVMTTKHHDGFCLFNTATTDRNAIRQGPKRDLVKDYVKACRKHGLKVGLYFSWPDWSIQAFNDGPEKDQKTWTEYVKLIHTQVRELCSNYGKIDLLWYDQAPNMNGKQFMTTELLHSIELNAMVRKLQPDILINDRSLLPEDFYTAEQHAKPPKNPKRLWEACMTMNRHWGYFPADDIYKSAKEIVHTLTGIASNRGNMLLNIGPKPDGTIGEPERHRLKSIGNWLNLHREAVDNVSPCPSVNSGTYGCSSSKNENVYLYVHWWHGTSITIANCATDFSSGVILGTNQTVTIQRKGRHVKLLDLPTSPPDQLCTVIKLTST
jgi:alpha-L-fucosidase